MKRACLLEELAGVCFVQTGKGEYVLVAEASLSGCEHGLELC